MSGKTIPALSGSAKSPVSHPKSTLYRSKKKLRMETHYFNTADPLPYSMTHESQPSPVKKVKAAKTLTFPTSEYTTNSNSWFKHVFGVDSDNGPTQHSFAAYGGKVCSGRPNHYDALKYGKTVPTDFQGFSERYIQDSDDDDIHAGNVERNPTDLPEALSSPPTTLSDKQRIQSQDAVKMKAASSATQNETETRKRSIPQEFISEQDRQRAQLRARIEENWEFGRALAKKQIEKLSKSPADMEKWVNGGETEAAKEPHESRVETHVGNKRLFEAHGKNSSFMILEMNVVTLGKNLLEMPKPV